jgi:hypothetical protein
MIEPDVVGVARKFTELFVRTMSPYPNDPHCPTVGVIEGVKVVVGVSVLVGVSEGVRVFVGVLVADGTLVSDGVGVIDGVSVNDGVSVIDGVGEIVAVRVLVAVDATPIFVRYGAAAHPIPLAVCNCHQTNPVALAGPPTTVPCAPVGRTVTTPA